MAKSTGVVEVACLAVILLACGLARLLGALLRVLRIEPMEAMLYLGLAEHPVLPPVDDR